MARSIPTAAATEAAKTTGAHPIRILEIQFAGGTQYFAGESLTSPVTASGKVKEWGTRKLDAAIGKVGGFGTFDVTLFDSDLSLKTAFDASPGLAGTHAYIHLYFSGTTWPGDRITEFGGVVTEPPSWTEASGTWRITISGFEDYHNQSLGKFVDRDTFPESVCTNCEGTFIPIVYGSPVSRVPACVVDRPGAAELAAQLNIHDSTLEIHRSAFDAGFTYGLTSSDDSTGGSEITLIVGFPGNFELITGFFASDDDTTFSITSRGAIQASGESPGTFGQGGDSYFLISKDDIEFPNQPRTGYPIWIDNDNTGEWVMYVTDYWYHEGDSIVVVKEMTNVTFKTGASWKLGRYKYNPQWGTGTPVYEVGTWTYAVNFLPSKSVDRVEAKGEVITPGSRGAKVERFFSYANTFYSVDLDNRSWNSGLGRDSGDPGITTVAINRPPTHYGFSDDNIFVTLKGITDDDSDLTPFTNPSDIINHLMTNSFLGGISSSLIDSTSFADAKSAISESFSLAITEEKQLGELVGDLARQAGCLLFWDQGKAFLERVSVTPESTVFTVDSGKYQRNSLSIGYVPAAEIATEVTGKFRTSPPSPERRIIRRSSDAAAQYGEHRQELNLWAYQTPVPVASIVERWLEYWIERHQTATFLVDLRAIALQPGDWVTLDIDSGNGTTLFDSVAARVVSVEQVSGNVIQQTMEHIRLTVESKLWDYTIESVEAPEDEDCEAPIEEPDIPDPTAPGYDNSPGQPGQPLPPQNTFPQPVAESSSGYSSGDESGDEQSTVDPSETCVRTLGGRPLSFFRTFNESRVQVLGHDANGCMKWYTVSSCDDSSSELTSSIEVSS